MLKKSITILKSAAVIGLLIGTAHAELIKIGPYHDPANYVIGWSSAAYTTLGDGRNCILFLYGNATSGDPNNSIRCFDAATGAVSYAQVDTERPDKVVTGDGLNDRDNHLSLSIPGRGLLVTGGAYLVGKEYFGGFFNYETLHWDYRNDLDEFFIKPEGFNWSTFNPATAWSEELNVGFVYGGYVSGIPSNFITLIHPQKDGTFQLEPLKGIPNTQSCMHMRNSAVAVGEWAYVVGGVCQGSANSKATDVPWFRRFNLVSHQWEQLDDLPVVRYLPQVTYDERTHDIVVYGGNGPASVQPGIAPAKMPDYWVGHNEVYTWNVHNQGPWIDRTAQANMPAVRMPVGGYDKTTGLHCYRGGQYFDNNGRQISGGYSSSTIWCLNMAANSDDEDTPPVDPPVSPPPADPPISSTSNPPVANLPTNPPEILAGEIHVAALSRLLPPIKSGLSPHNTAKHMRMTELGNRRLYIVAGDWGASDGRVPSGRQEIHSYDMFTDTWRLEAPYCSPDGKYPFHPDEVGQVWDPKRGVMWLGLGIRFPYVDTCNMGGGLGALAYFNPETRQWDQSKTLPPIPSPVQHNPRPPTNGIYDRQTDKLIFIDDKHTYYFDPNTEIWETYGHPYGRFSDGYVTQVGRWMYVVDEIPASKPSLGEPYTLYRWGIDTHALEKVADLPEDIRDGDGDDHGRVYLSALGKRIALYQQLDAHQNVKSLLYIYDTEAGTFQKVTWDNSQIVEGNTMVWHSSGWMALFGCTGSDGCSYKAPMDHIYLIDLRQFEGTGESLSKN
jgi:hypothetical protein